MDDLSAARRKTVSIPANSDTEDTGTVELRYNWRVDVLEVRLMKSLCWWFALICLAAALTARNADAQLPPPDNKRVAGVTIVNVALEGRTLNLAFVLTGLDAVGFVHAPRSAEETAKVMSALGTLEAPEEWLGADAAAACHRSFSGVTPHLYRLNDEHEAASRGKHRAPAEPAEIGVQYTFICDAPEQLREFRFDLIERFPHLRAIIVNVSRAGTSAQQMLATPQARISFTPANP
jgi:hypothetical protein